jgi:hypothetical protein
MSLAPIVLFVYNRPQHTLQTLEALAENYLANESELFIFADGPKKNADETMLQKIKETRAILRSKEWCKKTTIIEGEINKGLAHSIIDGVCKMMTEYDKVIVLEDDLVTSPYFLQYMNDALNVYFSSDSVACISGYVYPVKNKLPETFFIKVAECWGWATWKRAWNVFEEDGVKLLDIIRKKNLMREFDFEDSYPYTQMLVDQINKKNDSWAIRWYASVFLENKYCLYPKISLVQNIGMDGSGIHSGNSESWKVNLSSQSIKIDLLDVTEDKIARGYFSKYFDTLKVVQYSLSSRLLKKIIAFLKR